MICIEELRQAGKVIFMVDVKKTPTGHSLSPNYFKTKKKWIRASYSHYYAEKWYIFPVFAIVTVTGALFQS